MYPTMLPFEVVLPDEPLALDLTHLLTAASLANIWR
jgi:hypothetical protein